MQISKTLQVLVGLNNVGPGDLFCTSPSEEQDWEGRMSRERRAGSDHISTKRSENFDKIRQRRRERAGCKMGKQFISRQWRWLMGVAPFIYHPFYLPAVGKMASCLYHHQNQNICNQKWLTEWVSDIATYWAVLRLSSGQLKTVYGDHILQLMQ